MNKIILKIVIGFCLMTMPAMVFCAPAFAATSAKPQGELVAALSEFGNEQFIPWNTTMGTSPIMYMVYESLIYWDEVNRKFIPGLAESWEVSPNGLTTTYHLRKGVQFSDGWGEFTASDVKYTFEKHASPESTGKTRAARTIKNMEIPDPHTLVVHFKRPYPTFFAEFSIGAGATQQGIVCKQYVEKVGEAEAGRKPIGTGPFRLVESKTGAYHKFEALDTHWRVIPEFKYVTVRFVPEISTTIAMLKTGEVDLALVPAEHLSDLKASGVNTEVSPAGGSVVTISWGGICLPGDRRYDAAYHNKDPWTDARVRKAMTISIDRQAICDSIFAGGASPAGVPLINVGMEKYKHPYDPAAAKKLLKEAGYPDGFSFKAISYVQAGVPEMPRVVEAVVAYWQQIGLKPKIVVSDFSSYGSIRRKAKTAGEVSPFRLTVAADMLDRCFIFLMKNSPAPIYMDEGSLAIWSEGKKKVDPAERTAYVDKLNKYYFENYGPIPIARAAFCYAWTKKIAPFPQASTSTPIYLDYVRHAKPLNTFRLFTPWPGR